MTKPFMLSLFYHVDDTAILHDSTQNLYLSYTGHKLNNLWVLF